MPELPEVELVASWLRSAVAGRTIASAKLLRQRLAPHTPADEFAGYFLNVKVTDVGRRGKHILVGLDNGRTLVVHLRMSGRFSLLAAEAADPKFSHAVFNLSCGERLVFDDQRHFGLMKVVHTNELYTLPELAKLAPEPFSTDFSLAYFHTTLQSSTRAVKELMLDQTKVCGLGNIYASESLFAARMSPLTPAKSVSRRRASRLYQSIRLVLSEAISQNENSTQIHANIEDSYFNGSGASGWHVYGRERQPCGHCRSPIVRLKQGGRSTYFCRRCQRV